jgi:hypothetical protein
MRNSLEIIDTTWSPVLASPKDKELAAKLSEKNFLESHKKMLSDFEKLEPVALDDMGNTYVPFSEKLRVLEENFDFQTFMFSSQFLNMGATASPICYMTLLVLTDEGFRPWFSRMGMGDQANPGPDGLMADAETSAKRRILIALGMGKPGEEETSSERSVETGVIERYMSENNTSVADLVAAYGSRAPTDSAGPLDVKMASLKKIKDNGQEPNLSALGDSDIKKIAKFISQQK